ncbi:hypothetical protein [Pseudomonas monteilii]|uniref:hypothetical protein n=1 Tax=Pseudomonas monteilii TaxID=76759 RepID=UPI0007611143|nr:hypothetical protein [Pseudomonas monteilii]
MSAAVVERVLCVVDRCLKNQFPNDYYKRCLYASFGVHRLLEEMGYSPVIVGGNFGAFVVSRDERLAGIQGYASNSGEHSHYWVELNGSLIDLGTIYLPVESSYAAHEMQAMFWNLNQLLPKGLKYDAKARYSTSDASHLAAEIIEKMDIFIRACQERMAKPLVKPKIGKWLVTNQASIQSAAKKGDLWARAMIRYESFPG